MDTNGHSISLEEPSERLFTVDKPKDVIIEDNVWIGANCIILPGVHIGAGSIVSAGSVVKDCVERNSIVVGNPARVVKKINL